MSLVVQVGGHHWILPMHVYSEVKIPLMLSLTENMFSPEV